VTEKKKPEIERGKNGKPLKPITIGRNGKPKRGRQGEGRKITLKKITKDQLETVEKLAGVLNIENLADFFGIGITTFYEIMKRQPEVLESYKRGRQKAGAKIGTSIIQRALKGSDSLLMFYAKTRMGWRETRPDDEDSEIDVEIEIV